ncbi:MAG: hypothetical protein AAFX00_14015 [Pseudomonadota bacterium]
MLSMFRKPKLTSRGGAMHQSTDWVPLVLSIKTLFVHCGSCPLAQDTTGILLKYSKEVIKAKGSKSNRFILAFPLPQYPMARMVPEVLTLSKPCQMLWDHREMPHGFVFEIPAGKTVFAKGGELNATQEVAFNFDIIFEDYLVGQYRRKNKATMEIVPLNGVPWL